MPSSIDVFTKFINSPGGVLTAGLVLAGIVWKFFERVEAVLTEQTKFEIAVWLVAVKTSDHIPWPETFAKVFDRVFGNKHLSWRCFYRSGIASLACGLLGIVFTFKTIYGTGLAIGVVTFEMALMPWLLKPFSDLYVFVLNTYAFDLSFTIDLLVITPFVILFTNVLPDFISLLETRIILRLMKDTSSSKIPAYLVLDTIITYGTAVVWNSLFLDVTFHQSNILHQMMALMRSGIFLPWLVYPAFFTSIWLWLYAGSGFLLKAARRFDIGFGWFNRKFDIEKHPLQSIGLVAGAIVAIVYWTAVGVSRLL